MVENWLSNTHYYETIRYPVERVTTFLRKDILATMISDWWWKRDNDFIEHSETSENWHTLHLNHVQHLPENVTCLRSTPSSTLRFGIWWQRHVSRGGPWARLSGASKSWCWCWWNIPLKKTDQWNLFREHLFKNQVYLCWGKTWFPIFDPIIL